VCVNIFKSFRGPFIWSTTWSHPHSVTMLFAWWRSLPSNMLEELITSDNKDWIFVTTTWSWALEHVECCNGTKWPEHQDTQSATKGQNMTSANCHRTMVCKHGIRTRSELSFWLAMRSRTSGESRVKSCHATIMWSQLWSRLFWKAWMSQQWTWMMLQL